MWVPTSPRAPLLMTFAESSEVANADTPTRIRPGTIGQLEKQCPKCGEWVGLGRNGSLHTLLIHQDGQRCFRAAERRARAQAEQTLTLPVASASRGPPTFSPPLTFTHPYATMPESPFFPCPNIATTPTTLPLSPHSPPSLILPEQTPYVSSTIPGTLQTSPSPSLAMTKVPCLGVRLKWVCERPARTYPFQYHDTGNPTWFATTAGPYDPDAIYLRSISCPLSRDPFVEACSECAKIPSSAKFQSLVRGALKDPAPTTPHIFLSWEQLSCKLSDKTDECRQLRKKVCLTLCCKLMLMLQYSGMGPSARSPD